MFVGCELVAAKGRDIVYIVECVAGWGRGRWRGLGDSNDNNLVEGCAWGTHCRFTVLSWWGYRWQLGWL